MTDKHTPGPWHPISTVPTKGSTVILHWPDACRRPFIARYRRDDGWEQDMGGRVTGGLTEGPKGPTHWMPLPEPPSPQSDLLTSHDHDLVVESTNALHALEQAATDARFMYEKKDGGSAWHKAWKRYENRVVKLRAAIANVED